MSKYDLCDYFAHQDLRIIRKHEVAKMLGVSVRTVSRMIVNKQLPPPLLTPKGYVSGWNWNVLKYHFQ